MAPDEKDTAIEKGRGSEPSEQKETPAPPKNHLILNGVRLPCFVRAAVYKSGLAAGLGIKTTDPEAMAGLLQDEVKAELIRSLLRTQVDEELSRREITYGVKDEEIVAAIQEFMERASAGSDEMSTRIVAEGEAPEADKPGRLEYALNTGGQPIHTLGQADQLKSRSKIRQVKEKYVLVTHHPPESGKEGCDVRGEKVEPEHHSGDVSLKNIAGANTEVRDKELLATITGVCREDEHGKVRVIQEMEVEEVNAITGDLPRAGVAATNFLVKQGVKSGFGIFTSEDVFVGQARSPGTLEKNAPVRVRNLAVNGQVAGDRLPKPYLAGELNNLESSEKNEITHQMEKSTIEAEGIVAARDILGGRLINANRIMIQTHCYGAALNAKQDILVDGNLSGGVVSFRSKLQVMGNIGDEKGSATHVRLSSEDDEDENKDRFKEDIQQSKTILETLTEELGTHLEELEKRVKKSTYWAALYNGEKKAPNGAIETRLLMQFLQAVKRKSTLEEAIEDRKREIEDWEKISKEGKEDAGDEESGMHIIVKGSIYPGFTVEQVSALTAQDAEAKVQLKTGKDRNDKPLKEIKQQLTEAVNAYVEPLAEKIEEQKQAIDKMFEGREKTPEAPKIPNKAFHTELTFSATETETAQEGGQKLPVDGILFVNSRDPQSFFLKRIWKVKDPLKNVDISIEEDESGCQVKHANITIEPTAWQKDPQVREQLETIHILGRSAAEHLLD